MTQTAILSPIPPANPTHGTSRTGWYRAGGPALELPTRSIRVGGPVLALLARAGMMLFVVLDLGNVKIGAA